MGITIDKAIKNGIDLIDVFKEYFPSDKAIDTVGELVEVAKKYQKMQADYESRLKADMVAMLTEIQLEIEENTVCWYVGRVDGKSDDVVLIETINDIIQQKITNLQVNNSKVKEQTDG